jgi:predicted phosphodiesterase
MVSGGNMDIRKCLLAIIVTIFTASLAVPSVSRAQDAPVQTYRMGYPRLGYTEWINGSLTLLMAWSPSPDDKDPNQNWFLQGAFDAKEYRLPAFVVLNTDGDRNYGVFGIEGEPYPEGLYNLCHRTSNNVLQCEPHSVNVRNGKTDNFDFGVITDVHLNDPRGESLHKGVSAETIYRRSLEEMNRRGVAFVLILGDLASMPPKVEKEFRTVRDVTVELAHMPVYFVPGNHDEFTTMTGDNVKSDDLIAWKKYFNPGFLSFDFGNMHFTGLNTYDRPPRERNLFGGVKDIDGGGVSDTQLQWLEGDLTKSAGKNIVMFAHHNPFETFHDPSSGGFRISVFTPLGRDKLIDLMKKNKVAALFVGHTHKNFENETDGIKIYSTSSISSFTDDNQPNSMRIVHVKKGKISGSQVIPTNIAP